MDGGGGHAPAPSQPSSSANGGEFLLSLLQKRNQSQSSQPQNMTVDPAVAAVGPSIHSMPWSSSSSNNGHDLSSHPLPPWSQSSPYPPPNFFLQGFPQNPWNPPGNNFPGNQFPGNNFQHALLSGDDVRRLGFQQQPPKPELMFGSLPFDIQKHEGLLNSNRTDNSTSGSDREGLLSKIEVQMKREFGLGNGSSTGLDRNRQFELQGSSNSHRIGNYDNREQDRRGNNDGWGRQLHGVVHRPSHETPRPPPPGFPSNPRGGRNSDSGNWRISSEHNVGVENGGYGEFNNNRVVPSVNEVEILRRRSPDHNNSNSKARSGETLRQPRLTDQFDRPGPHSGINLHSASASEIEESMMNLHAVVDENEHAELDGSSDNKDEKKRHKDVRSDTRGNWLLSQKMRNLKRQMIIRRNIDTLHAPFLAIYETLIPAEEEKAKQKQLLALLEKLVSKEWPKAHLYLYGSCASSFGVSKSDIDVCFAIEDPEINKSDLLLRLADILKSDNLQNVQALTRARVPIVKLMDPVTGISCDICVNNVLAVVNTKLLRDYAQIDVRLRQLAFLVKHWAKSRGVNATYQGTLSSYAYVIMCIHFLQQRKPAVLPCLQRMEATFSATIDNVECAYFDRVDKLRDFGSHNKENIAQLVWGFFNYWAYCHDYANTVISVRTGSIISKQSKDWTKRIGNDRHLICIEDPFETSHDLGRVVDKYSIKVLREEFERAANIMQFDPNPCVKLFEPYVPEGRQSN